MTPKLSDVDFLVIVYGRQAMGVGALVLTELSQYDQAARLEREGLLVGAWMLFVGAKRFAYSLTQAGLDRVPETERYAGNVDVAEIPKR